MEIRLKMLSARKGWVQVALFSSLLVSAGSLRRALSLLTVLFQSDVVARLEMEHRLRGGVRRRTWGGLLSEGQKNVLDGASRR